MSLWLAIPGAAVALIAIVGYLWKIMRIAARVDRAVPVLLSIAEEFSNNGGSTLKDKIDRIEKTLAERNARLDNIDRVLASAGMGQTSHTP